MSDTNELVERKIFVLIGYPFFKEFIESGRPKVGIFLDNLRNFPEIKKELSNYDVRLLEHTSYQLSKIPKNDRLAELARALTDISSFEVRNISFHIEPLSKLTMKDAIRLLNNIFPLQALYERADVVLRASLALEKGRIKSWLYKLILRVIKISEVRYWIIIDESSDKVIGITGLYCYKKDQNEADWVGWMGVNPNYRRLKLGNKLIDFVIVKAKNRGKKFLRLYTSTDPNERIANIMYDRKGFRIFKREPLKGTNLELLYQEKEL